MIKHIYNLYVYRLYLFYKDDYFGGVRDVKGATMMQIVVWHLMNFIALDQIAFNFQITKNSNGLTWAVVFVADYLIHLFIYKNIKDEISHLESYKLNIGKVTSIMVTMYILLSPIVLILSFII